MAFEVPESSIYTFEYPERSGDYNTLSFRGTIRASDDVITENIKTSASRYDIQSYLNNSYHLYITDKTGRSVVVEWTDNEMYITEDNCCTNNVLSTEHGTQWSCVYDLDDFTISICTKRNYDDPHKFERENFK